MSKPVHLLGDKIVPVKQLFQPFVLAGNTTNLRCRFETALQERYDDGDAAELENGGPEQTSAKTTKTLVETSNDLKKARMQLAELSSMRAEMHSLRLDLHAAEKKASRLRDENLKLALDLSQVDTDLRESMFTPSCFVDR
jgi:hypothetical protein